MHLEYKRKKKEDAFNKQDDQPMISDSILI